MIVTDSQHQRIVDMLTDYLADPSRARHRLSSIGRSRVRLIRKVLANIDAEDGELFPHDLKVVLGALYERLVNDTWLDALGELGDAVMTELYELRTIASQIITELQFTQVQPNLIRVAGMELSHAELTRMGLYDLVPTDKIEGYAEGRGQLSIIAKHLLKQSRGRKVYQH
jgi:hypothetical protein